MLATTCTPQIVAESMQILPSIPPEIIRFSDDSRGDKYKLDQTFGNDPKVNIFPEPIVPKLSSSHELLKLEEGPGLKSYSYIHSLVLEL